VKMFIALTAIAVCGLVPDVGQSQIPSIPGFGSKSGGPDLMASQTGLVTSYVGASKDVLTSQSKMLLALGLKDQAAKAQAESDALGTGATTGNLKDEATVQSDDSKALADALKAPNSNLDARIPGLRIRQIYGHEQGRRCIQRWSVGGVHAAGSEASDRRVYRQKLPGKPAEFDRDYEERGRVCA
jgi:hypothetical protein